MSDIKVVDPISTRIERWVGPRWIPVQIWAVVLTSAPWLLVPFHGLRWAWISMAILPVAAYFFIGAAVVRDLTDEEDNANR